MQYINKAYLLIGGNEGDRISYLHGAAENIAAICGNLHARSSIYETAAWGILEQATFYNQALELQTSFQAIELMLQLLRIENGMGRKRTVKYGPRSIDIDILLFNDEVIETPQLSVPHPALPQRRFALEPLAEIAGDKVHPVLKKTITQLLRECPDTLPVTKTDIAAAPQQH